MGRPTMVDVAQAAGVSPSTVERVLSGRHAVRPETASKVLKAAEEIGFYGTRIIRDRMRLDLPQRRLGFVLQQPAMPFHRALGDQLKAATVANGAIRGIARVDYCDDLTPHVTADRLERLGGASDAVAIVSTDHPSINAAADRLAAAGIPVFAAVSDIHAHRKVAYIGVNNRMLGRTAAWLTTKMGRPGKLAILLGGHRYLCQEQREIGFRSFVREHCPDVEVLEPSVTHEDEDIAYEATEGLLKRHPNLSGLFVAGGGVRGVVRALDDNAGLEGCCVTCVERTPETEDALLRGVISAILAHPMQRLARRIVDTMVAHTAERSGSRGSEILDFEIYTPENIASRNT